jgi:hypothetical protein
VGKANGSRECAPDDKLRVPTVPDHDLMKDGGHGAGAFAHPTFIVFVYALADAFRDAITTPASTSR